MFIRCKCNVNRQYTYIVGKYKVYFYEFWKQEL